MTRLEVYAELRLLRRKVQLTECSALRLQEQNRPDINIVCEKIAFQGLTRFENRQALPLGVSTNFTAYSAKLLTQVICQDALHCVPASWHPAALLSSAHWLRSWYAMPPEVSTEFTAHSPQAAESGGLPDCRVDQVHLMIRCQTLY